MPMFRYNGMEYKEGVHGFLYYKTQPNEPWCRSCDNEAEILAVVDKKNDPMGIDDSNDSELYRRRMPSEIARSLTRYHEWRATRVTPNAARCTEIVTRSEALKILKITPKRLSQHDLHCVNKGGETFYKLTDIKRLI